MNGCLETLLIRTPLRVQDAHLPASEYSEFSDSRMPSVALDFLSGSFGLYVDFPVTPVTRVAGQREGVGLVQLRDQCAELLLFRA
jgi:hypothetical protein